MARNLPGQEVIFSLPVEQVLSSPAYPKYVSQLINLANQNSGATRPENVGQISDLVAACPHRTVEGWTGWYLQKFPRAVDEALPKIREMLLNFAEALTGSRPSALAVDDAMIRTWLEDLIFVKSLEGIHIQYAILAEMARRENTTWRTATPEEEAQNIDGFVGDRPVSIKPDSYLAKKSTVHEKIDVQLVFYRKTATYINVYGESSQLELVL